MILRREFGVTFPFSSNDVIGYGKTYTAIEIDTDKPIGDQLEVAAKIANTVDTVLDKFTETQIARIMKGYSNETAMDENGDPVSTELDPIEITKAARQSLGAQNVE